MLSAIITLYPDHTPSPTPSPQAVRFAAQQAIEQADSEFRAIMRRDYGQRLPIVIPAHWTRERIQHFAHGGQHPQPSFIGTVGTRIKATRKRDAVGARAA